MDPATQADFYERFTGLKPLLPSNFVESLTTFDDSLEPGARFAVARRSRVANFLLDEPLERNGRSPLRG